MRKKIIKKSLPKEEKLKIEIKQIRADLKKLKKSKKRMQLLWYRTKREHVALIKDLDLRLKAIKKEIKKKKLIVKRQGKKTQGRKKMINKK
jgi:hypothetical protein